MRNWFFYDNYLFTDQSQRKPTDQEEEEDEDEDELKSGLGGEGEKEKKDQLGEGEGGVTPLDSYMEVGDNTVTAEQEGAPPPKPTGTSTAREGK